MQYASTIINDIMLFVEKNYILILIILIIINIVAFVFLLLQKRNIAAKKNESLTNERILKILDISKGIDKSFELILLLISDVLYSANYSLYLYEAKSDTYQIKATRNENSMDADIGPSYSGLLPYKKEIYVHPTSIVAELIENQISFAKDGEVTVIDIPLLQKKCLIRIGPVKKSGKKSIPKLTKLCDKISPVVNNLIDLDYMKDQVSTVLTSSSASTNLSGLLGDINSTVNIIIGLCIKSIEAFGGAFLLENTYNEFDVISVIGLEDKIKELFIKDKETHELLYKLVHGKESFFVTKDKDVFYELPSYIASVGVESFILIPSKLKDKRGYSIFWFREALDIVSYRMTAVLIIQNRLTDILNNHMMFKSFSDSYVDVLKILVQMYDNIAPFSVGSAELMYRYAQIICRELKLTEAETYDISLAAYLSNIGVIGLSSDIINKKGKYTELEFELMKLHCEVGASIISATIGNSNVANIIKHHHERMDGCGYPAGLHANEIPIGSKIIAVIQTFLAKLTGRPERSPVSFQQAIELLKNSSETQLDSNIVNTLINWFIEKQLISDKSKSLGPCWEMRCSPESICSKCPAYMQFDKNCWDFGGSICKEHGNECKSCFIRSEYLYRNS